VAKGQEKDVLYRVVKFEIKPDDAQLAILRKASDGLWLVWNEALEARQKLFDEFIAPIYERMKEASKAQDADRLTELRKELGGAYREHKITLYDQINALTPRRTNDKAFASVPRNWQEETLDTLDGAFKSFLALRKNGDPKARAPRIRNEWDFCEISGRYGFKVIGGKEVALSCDNLSGGIPLIFGIPEDYQQVMLARASAVKKFTLYRDERDMRKPGRFWISLAYEIPKPEVKPFVPEEAVFVSLGASSLGIISPKGEEVVALWRPDKHWKPKIDAIEERMKRCAKKGSRKWHRLNGARLKMLRLMAAQQKLDQREVVARELLRHGVHFVISDLVVRSKKGKLADASNPDRGGALGLNWSAQNTGSLGYLAQWLEEKAQEHGGTVRKHKLLKVPQGLPTGHENKIPMVRALRDDFLRSYRRAA